MKTESTASLTAITLVAIAMAVATLAGCSSTKQKAVIETKVPNVWDENPTQSLAIKLEITK
tara:strand:- start:1013 stop:1195 length:183 start_codon:yes stop_codon:yes gene_type:complete